ncbi:nucleotide-binding domain containing protein [Streptomyces scopuliridis]|uniref:nucleotide-binding domain containing protein n=1 Tax=Streptomyces scopuliridis TaxID=452529 RepID=UPI0036B91C5B
MRGASQLTVHRCGPYRSEQACLRLLSSIARDALARFPRRRAGRRPGRQLPTHHLNVLAAEALAWYDAQDPAVPVLIYASASPDEHAPVQSELGVAAAAERVEELLDALAARLVGRGLRRLIVAGGETAGAVTTALGIRTVLVADEADPGVPWTYATTPSGDLALMLKSGNFGAQTCFSAASGRPSSEPVRR